MKMKTVSRSDVSTIRMVAGRERKIKAIIIDNHVHR